MAMRSGGILDSFCSKSNLLNRRQRILFFTLSFFAVCFLYLSFLLTVKFAFDFSFDEPFYLSVCERLFKGDRLIVDEWSLPQFTVLFQFLPYFVFRTVAGSTEGAVLFMRYVYIGTSFCMFCYIIVRYRKHPWLALINAFLFCSFVPLCVFLFGYYYLPLLFMFAFATILIDDEAKLRKSRLVLAGILLSCSVVLDPGLAVLWVVYCVFVLLRLVAKKKGKSVFSDYDFVLRVPVFARLLLGVVLSVAALLLYFQISSGLGLIIRFLPNLIFNAGGIRTDSVLRFTYLFGKLEEFIKQYGLFFWLTLCYTVAVCVFRILRSKIKNAQSVKKALFFAGAAVFAFTYLSFFKKGFSLNPPILMEPPIMIAWFGLNCIMLCENRNPKMLFFWLIGASLSATQDLISETSLGFGSVICLLPTVSFLIQLIRELYPKTAFEPGHDRKKKHSGGKKSINNANRVSVPGVVFVLLLSFVLAWGAVNVGCFSYYFRKNPVDEPRSVINVGPYKGISMPEGIRRRHDNMIADLDTIKGLTQKNAFVMGGYPFAYMYMDRGVNAMSSGNMVESESSFEKYWVIFPDKRPEIVYIPTEAESAPVFITNDAFQSMPAEQSVDFGWFAGRAIKGKGGLIVQVSSWGPVTQLKNDFLF